MKLPVYAKVDLTSKAWETFHISEEYFKKYIGGKCLAARLLLDLTEKGIDPLSPEATVIINTSPLNGTASPSSSRFNMTFKNVLTGGIASSNSGGQFGVMMKRAGFDGLIITGKAEKPTMLEIVDGTVTFKSAEDLWGMDTEETQQKLPKAYGKIVIGTAGENLVRYASAASGERMSGRCGTGAVFGSKNLKAIIAFGKTQPEVAHPEKFKKFVKKWITFIKNHPMTGDSLPKYGSAGIVNKANASYALPTHNFKYGHFEKADATSGETLAETRLVKNNGCVSCPIRCERRVMMEGKEVKGPEYETLGLLGANIDSDDLDMVLKINYMADDLGMDTISLASTIAFAMELKERGIADFGVEFGKTDNLPEIVTKIAHREGIYSDLANGTKWLSEKYSGAGFAMHVKGLEIASYEPRRSVGMGLGYATSNRGGCHLNGGYLALLESVGVLSIDPQNPGAKAQLSVFMQDALEAVSSSGSCLFSAQTFVPAILFKMGPNHPVTRFIGKVAVHVGGVVNLLLKATNLICFNSLFLLPHAESLHLVTGLKMKTGDFIDLGERSFNLERMYNIREGLTTKDDTLPERLLRTRQDTNDTSTVVPLDKMLPVYYKTRGWDEKGVPTEKKLKKLGII
ncbi:MAG: aldehyde ferredoxin oxidoreductase family protein [Oscillospiraceae bacterium]|nr:aldehyde ferredoxin oxidoreductase family protein [Oscillospiraceae bacterium]